MRRNRRQKNKNDGFGNLLFITGTVLLISVIVFGIVYAIYNSKLKSEARVSQLNSRKIGELVPSIQSDIETQSASTLISKSVDEVKEEEETAIKQEDNKTYEETIPEPTAIREEKTSKPEETEAVPTKKELMFKMPVDGEIIMKYAEDNLVYSDTLEEWITHLGIDIEADKTTVVKSSEEGTVKSIKNDPRYGLTVIVEHADGFKTVYSNLLTSEFVSEGEKLQRGQTIGTVGTSAAFEITEPPHLHFEIWKDGKQVDPEIYVK